MQSFLSSLSSAFISIFISDCSLWVLRTSKENGPSNIPHICPTESHETTQSPVKCSNGFYVIQFLPMRHSLPKIPKSHHFPMQYNLLKTTCRQPTTTCRQPITTCRQPTKTCRQPITTCRQPTTTCRQPFTTCRQPLLT